MRAVKEIVTDIQESQGEIARIAPTLAAAIRRVDDPELTRQMDRFAVANSRVIMLAAELLARVTE